jgi:hypothetical protein
MRPIRGVGRSARPLTHPKVRSRLGCAPARVLGAALRLGHLSALSHVS